MLASQVMCPQCSRRLVPSEKDARKLHCPRCGRIVAAAPAAKSRPAPILQSKPYAPPPGVQSAAPPRLAAPPVAPLPSLAPTPIQAQPRSRKGLWFVMGGLGTLLLLALGLVAHEAWSNRATPLASGTTPTSMEPPPSPPGPLHPVPPVGRPLTEEERQVNEAIERGVAYLRKQQRKDGTFSSFHPLGLTALPALTLLECGAAPTDPQVELAARYVRARAPKETATYEISLCLLFLDRLGDAQDRGLIRTLALRLMAAQTAAGGWHYQCPILSREEEDALDQTLRRLPRLEWTAAALGGQKPIAPPPAPGKTQPFELPSKVRRLPVVQAVTSDQPPPAHDQSDNSNTQFAILGVWAARRHGVPVDRSLALIERRFRGSQSELQGGWGYNYVGGGYAGSSPAMTCAGLLGLAVGYGRTEEGTDRPASRHVEDDQAIRKGLEYISNQIEKPQPKRPRRPGAVNLYLLWSIERVGILYGLKEIGDKDWYAWGSQLLVASQNQNGSWTGDNHSGDPPCATSLALLFLKRVNLVWDLPTKFRGKPAD